MDTRGRAAVVAGLAVVGAGAVAWALAATSAAAVHAGEVRARAGASTEETPGDGELTLLAHDARLAALVVVAAGTALVCSRLPRQAASRASAGVVVAAAVGNATLGRAVDGGPVLLAAVALLLVVGAAGAAGGLTASRAPGARGHAPGGRGYVVGAGALGAGTLPVLVLQGTGSARYGPWVPADLATSEVVTALALTGAVVVASLLTARGPAGVVGAVALPLAAAAVLMEPTGSSWQVRGGLWVMGAVLVLAAAPLLLTAAGTGGRPRRRCAAVGLGLLVTGGLLALVPGVLAVPVLAGGVMGLVVTGPAGASIDYDGLPVVGGGLLLAAVLVAVRLLVIQVVASPELGRLEPATAARRAV